ncbi:MAG TPA: hypothetical protein VGK10_21055 [Prolixibacteraceae bacterium]
MKKFLAYILLLLPGFALGQLFPKLPDFRGHIQNVTERRYGKEMNATQKDSGVFKPKAFSGWEYFYQFENSKLAQRTSKMNGEVNANYLYQREELGNRRIEREILQDSLKGKKGDYIEYENFINERGEVERVNFWSYNARENRRDLFLVEMNAEYDHAKLMSYTRHVILANGDMDTGEKCSLFYDSSDRLVRMERKDIATGLNTILYYYYNKKGFVNRFSIDYLVGLRNDQNTQRQDIHYKYDRRGNWVKRYWVAENKKRLEDRRKIKYS